MEAKPNHNVRRTLLVTTMFDHGGVVSYWKDVMEHAGDREWCVFVNRAPNVDPDPFQKRSVRVDTGFVWSAPLKASKNLIGLESTFAPDTVAFNATFAIVKLFPAILYFRLFRPALHMVCVFHNGRHL